MFTLIFLYKSWKNLFTKFSSFEFNFIFGWTQFSMSPAELEEYWKKEKLWKHYPLFFHVLYFFIYLFMFVYIFVSKSKSFSPPVLLCNISFCLIVTRPTQELFTQEIMNIKQACKGRRSPHFFFRRLLLFIFIKFVTKQKRRCNFFLLFRKCIE